MRTLIQLSLALFFILNFESCLLLEVEKGMVRLDQAFIPVFYYTWKGDLANAQDAAFNLEYQWQQFQHRYGSLLPEDEEWQEGFRRTQSWLDDAYAGLEINMRELALNQLDHARYEMMELRACKGIDYYLDDLYNFQIDLTEIHEVASDDMLCLLEWSEFELMIKGLDKNWAAILAKPFDAELYEFDRFKAGRFGNMQRMIAMELDELVFTLTCADHFMVAKKAKDIELLLMKMLTEFGRFSNKTSVALEI